MNLNQFANLAMTTDEMRATKGGQRDWCYSYDCSCGGTSYNGWGDLASYQEDASANCSGAGPVSCSFGSLPPGTCG
jgi:hypothetical protein